MRTRVMLGFVILATALGLAPAAVGQQTPPGVAYVDALTPSLPRVRNWIANAPSPQQVCSSVTNTVLWEMMATSPTANQRALATVTSDRILTVQMWNGATWGTPMTVASDVGYPSTRSYAISYEQRSGDLLVCYRKRWDNRLYFRTATAGVNGAAGGLSAEQTLNLSMDTAPQQVVLISKANSDETVVVVRTLLCLYAAVWNGSSFGNTRTLAFLLPWRGMPFDGAYTTASGQAVVVWSTWIFFGAQYATWDGSSWSGSHSLPGFNNTRWLSAAGNPKSGTDTVIIGGINRNRQVVANVYNGSNWANATVMDNDASTTSQHRVGVCFQPDGALGMIAWHSTGRPSVSFSRWNGSVWGTPTSGPSIGGETRMLTMARGAVNDEILMATVRKSDVRLVTDYTAYSLTGNVNVNSTDVEGEVGQRVTGVLAPLPPVAVAGLANVSVGNGATSNLAPGSYLDLSMGNNAELRLVPGTYTFRKVTIGNGAEIKCDTTGGNVVIQVALSGFSAGSNFILGPNDEEQPGVVFVHVVGGNTSIGDSSTLKTGLFWTYNGSATFGSSASIVSLVYARNNVTFQSGDVDPSDQITPGGQLNITSWRSGVAQLPFSLSGAIGGGGNTEPYWLCGTSVTKMFVARWREANAGN